jgi:5-methyltetrahydropteroyltriglutamate--homocysteine methyltransferase
VAEVVDKQVKAGVSIVNDGEMSKPSYATYVKDRLNGFGGASHPLTYRTSSTSPRWPSASSAIPGAHVAARRPVTGRSASAIRAPR